jgi:two-component system phosphate regulon sensor histidine kinase PhoR
MIKTGMRFKIVFPAEGMEIVSDKDCIQQILVNLLSNAVKYSPSPGTIRIEGMEQESSVSISVIDEGPGIPESERGKIFQAFYRCADVVNRKTPGTGLGLTITRAIVEALGGRIRVESGPGQKGSNFTFVLPKQFDGGGTIGKKLSK